MIVEVLRIENLISVGMGGMMWILKVFSTSDHEKKHSLAFAWQIPLAVREWD